METYFGLAFTGLLGLLSVGFGVRVLQDPVGMAKHMDDSTLDPINKPWRLYFQGWMLILIGGIFVVLAVVLSVVYGFGLRPLPIN